MNKYNGIEDQTVMTAINPYKISLKAKGFRNGFATQTARMAQQFSDESQRNLLRDPNNEALQSSAEDSRLSAIDAAQPALSNFYIDFDATPDINESGSANYNDISEIRAPASIMIYSGTPSRTYQINAKMFSRTQEEARRTEKKLNVLRSWRMPEALTGGFAVAVPAILELSGYKEMFKNIPVVMTNLSIDFSSEFDSIRARRSDTPIPIVVPVSITLREIHNSEDNLSALEKFDIANFREGTLPNW